MKILLAANPRDGFKVEDDEGNDVTKAFHGTKTIRIDCCAGELNHATFEMTHVGVEIEVLKSQFTVIVQPAVEDLAKIRLELIAKLDGAIAACGVESRCERKCECPRCGGAGSFVEGGALNPQVQPCERCDGTGKIDCVEMPGMP
jgi:hypothetical protein